MTIGDLMFLMTAVLFGLFVGTIVAFLIIYLFKKFFSLDPEISLLTRCISFLMLSGILCLIMYVFNQVKDIEISSIFN